MEATVGLIAFCRPIHGVGDAGDCVKLACADHTGDKGRDGRLRCEDVLASMASNQGELVRSLDSLEREAPAMHAS